jgi:uncharacterized RDD family membrane protein YckC
MTTLIDVALITAAWVALGLIIGAAWCGTCAWYDARAARRERRGGYLR